MKTPVALFAIAMSFGTATAGSTVKTIPKDYDPAQKEECIVIGRFTVRRGCSADFGRKLALLDSSTVAREWIGWNTKKIARTLMGAAYSHLVDWGCRVDSWIASSRWRTRHPG